MNDVDLAIDIANNGSYDIGIAENGDFALEDGLDTALLMSIFCERRAAPSEVPDAIKRRGWIGNLFADNDFEIGSKFWIYENSRLTNDTINGIKDAVLNGAEWLIEDNIASDITADITVDRAKGKVDLAMRYEFSSGKIEQRFYNLWINTGR